ncbi:MAG: hypothetical protein Q8M02_03460 [Candidatus Didemnitutus sp.]|nr:hypothetical protein [Candidatus Didemnitutus sp.]
MIFSKTARVCLIVVAALLSAATTAQATTVVPPEFTELVNGSDYVVRAKVRSLSYEARQHEGREIIFTHIELEVTEVIVGTPPTPLVLTMLGGRVGDSVMTVEGVPKFVVGEEEIFFVAGNGVNFYPTYAVMHGRYPVRKDKATGREYITRTNGVPLSDVAEVAAPMPSDAVAQAMRRLRKSGDALSPVDFVQQIKQARVARGLIHER